MLYYFTACSKNAIKHLNNTIEKKVNLSQYSNEISDIDYKKMKNLGLIDGCYIWGAINGKNNVRRWSNMEIGDDILIYSEGIFKYYGKIAYKFNNKKLAEKLWGKDKNNNTWEYMFVINNLVPIKITIDKFNEFFQYNSNFIPQGYSNINEEQFCSLIKEYTSVDEIIKFLNNDFATIENNIKKEIEAIGEKSIEEAVEEMSDYKFDEYIKSLDTSASIKIIEGIKKVRKYNREIIKELKKRYGYRCQICGQTTIEEYGQSIVEAHHIESFSLTQNNKPENILILCPNHHRLVHRCNAKVNKKDLTVEYDNGKVEKIKLIISK